MKKNRKQAETYRFNGYPHLDPGSIHSVGIGTLEIEIAKLRRKLANPDDKDDKRWTSRWLRLYERELAKKERGLTLKRQEATRRRARGS